jgi:hypothetical protein
MLRETCVLMEYVLFITTQNAAAEGVVVCSGILPRVWFNVCKNISNTPIISSDPQWSGEKESQSALRLDFFFTY